MDYSNPMSGHLKQQPTREMLEDRIRELERALREILAIEDCGDYYHDFCQCLDGSEYRPNGAKLIARRALEGK